MKSRKLAADISVLGAALSFCGVAPAQQVGAGSGDADSSRMDAKPPIAASGPKVDPAATENVLPVVTVTAQKRTEAINSVALPIIAKTGAQLRDEGIKSAAELGAITPGLTVTETAPTGVPVYTLRGVGFADFATSSSSTVGLYVDEVSIPYPVMSGGALFDLERVEVLKGPQGDLYGRNTTAGQVNFIAAKPSNKTQAGVVVDYGRFGVADVEGYGTGAIANDLLGRISFKAIRTLGDQGWQESVSRPGDKLGKKNLGAVRGQLNWLINEDTALLLTAHWNRDKSDNVAPTAYDGTLTGNPAPQFLPTAYPASPYFSVANNRLADWSSSFRPQKNDRLAGWAAKLDWDASEDFHLTSITAYDRMNRSDRFETEGVPFEAGHTENKSKINAFSQELRLTSSDRLPLSWLAGLYFSRDKLAEDYNFFFKDSFYGTALGINKIATHYDQTTTSGAVFGHAEWKFADNYKLVLGTRLTREKRNWSGCTYDAGDGSLATAWNGILTPFTILSNGLPDPGVAAPGSCAIYDDIAGSANFGKFAPYSDQINTHKWQGKIGVNHTLSKDSLLYANVSRGFKSGGFNGASAQTHSQLKPYMPEELTDYEAGVKLSLLDRRVQFNASAFYYDYRDKQEQTIAVTPVGNISGLTNIPKSKVTGIEFQLNALVAPGLTQSLSVAYLETRILDYQAISNASAYPNVITYDASGMHLPNAPRWQLSSTTTYEWGVAEGLRMSVAGDINFKDDTAGSTQPVIPAYTLFNARVGLADPAKNWTVNLYGRNLGNKYYWTAALSGNATYARINGAPMTYGIVYTQKF